MYHLKKLKADSMNTIRTISRLLTLPVPGKERRKCCRLKTEAFIHKILRTEHYQCELVFEGDYLNHRHFQQHNKYHLISLGYNCFGRLTFSFWGLKPRKADGEKTMPFDISVHPLQTVTSLLQSGFQGYFDNIKYDETKQCWINPACAVEFVHDKENDRALFVARYKTRIENLNAAVQDDVPCLFFCYTEYACRAEDINLLDACLSELCAHKKHKLCFMIFNNPVPAGIDAGIAVYSANYPAGYRHMDKFTKYRKPGLTFEKQVVDFVRQTIEDMLI